MYQNSCASLPHALPPFPPEMKKGKERKEAFKRKSRKRQKFPPSPNPLFPQPAVIYMAARPRNPFLARKDGFFCLPPSPDLKPPRERRREECCNQSQKRTFFPLIESREPHFSPLGDQPSFLPTPPHHLLCPPHLPFAHSSAKGETCPIFQKEQEPAESTDEGKSQIATRVLQTFIKEPLFSDLNYWATKFGTSLHIFNFPQYSLLLHSLGE